MVLVILSSPAAARRPGSKPDPLCRNAASPTYKRIAFVASDVPEAQRARQPAGQALRRRPAGAADVIVALGGDGLMLETLQRFMNSGKPIYGMHRGTVGFLMNEYSENGLPSGSPPRTHRHPSAFDARTRRRRQLHEHRAINEVSLFRQTYQAARLRISVDGKERLAELVADGILLATPAGSTAYNLSAQGPIIPINAPLLALTPISPFRPRRWRGALLPDRARVTIEVLEAGKRPVAAVADHDEVRSVR